MNKLKLLVTALLIIIICSVGGAANASSYYESVEELLLLMKMDENLNYSFAQLRPIILEPFQQGEDLTPEQVQIMEKYIGKMLDLMEEEMGWDRIKDDFIQVYMSVYTEEEIQELIKFYQTPVGQKTVEQTPILLERSMEISQKYLMATLPKIQAIAGEMEEELAATFDQ